MATRETLLIQRFRSILLLYLVQLDLCSYVCHSIICFHCPPPKNPNSVPFLQRLNVLLPTPSSRFSSPAFRRTERVSVSVCNHVHWLGLPNLDSSSSSSNGAGGMCQRVIHTLQRHIIQSKEAPFARSGSRYRRMAC